MDQRTLKTSLCCMCCRASEVRFCAAELKLGFMKAESLKPAEILWRTFTENFFFFPQILCFIYLNTESFILFPVEIKVSLNASFLICSKCDRAWKVVLQCPLNPSRECHRSLGKDKIIEIKKYIYIFFWIFFCFLKINHSLFVFFSFIV